MPKVPPAPPSGAIKTSYDPYLMDDSSHHRAPVLLQSTDDHDQHHYSDHLGPHGPRHSPQPHAGLLHPPEDVIPYPGHVHTKDCRDVCPDQDLYTETAYIRFNKGMRTNIYGLSVVEELCPGQPERSGFQSGSTDALLTPGATPKDDYSSDQHKEDHDTVASSATAGDAVPRTVQAPPLTKSIFTDRIGRYVLVASSGLVTCYVGMEHSFEISLGLNQEVISIDVYESTCQGGYRVVMSIAIARAEESGTQFEMVFYGARTYAKTIMDHILSFPCTSDIQRIPIGWAPTKILHVPLTMDLSEMAILVGGGDTKVHSFIKDESGNIAEQPTEDYFPILSTFHHSHNCILSMDVRDYPDFRVIAAGTQNGTLNVAIIPRDRATNELQHAKARNHSVILFSPITSLAIYTSRVRAMDAQGKALRHDRRDLRTSIASAEDDKSNNPDEGATEDVHLLMTCAIEQAWVYTAINRNGLAKRSEIAACGHHDSILTSYVMDIDWDGENELVIGTYGRQLMVFKQVHGYFVHQASGTSDAPLRYELYWNRRFAYPVYGISSADMNSDGLEELVITTMYGISFFQADSTAAKRRLAGAINKMAESERLKLRLERLRAENLQLESEAEEQMARIQTMEQAEIEAEEMAERAEEAKEHAGGAGEATAEQSGSLDIPDAQESRKEESSSVPSGQADEPSLQPKIDQSRHGDGCVLADSGDQISEASSERADRNEGDKEQPPESSASPQRGHFVPGPSEVVGANPESDAGSPSATSEPEHELKNDQQQSGGEPIERGYGSEHDTNQ